MQAFSIGEYVFADSTNIKNANGVISSLDRVNLFGTFIIFKFYSEKEPTRWAGSYL